MSTAAVLHIAVDLLLFVGAAISLICALGLLLMDGFHDKLHYLAPLVLATATVVLAVFLEQGVTSSSIKALLAFLVVTISNPVLTYAAARAEYLRREGKK